MWFDAPVALPGWEVFRGVDLFGHYDYACYGLHRSPNVNQCQYHGTAQVRTAETFLVIQTLRSKALRVSQATAQEESCQQLCCTYTRHLKGQIQAAAMLLTAGCVEEGALV